VGKIKDNSIASDDNERLCERKVIALYVDDCAGGEEKKAGGVQSIAKAQEITSSRPVPTRVVLDDAYQRRQYHDGKYRQSNSY
jgi:hypothetical protein